MKPAASLSATLLAKKGTAAPTGGLEPKGFIDDVPKGPRDMADVANAPDQPDVAPNVAQADVAEPAVTTKIERAQSAAAAISLPSAAATPSRRATKRQVGAGKRIAMTLRLEHDQHLKLRLFSAHLKRSSQEVMMDALERYFREEAPESLDRALENLQS